MNSDPQSFEAPLQAYLQDSGLEIQRLLGAGYDGTVFATNRKSAIKVMKWPELYSRERDIYLRLRERQVQEIAGCQVPQLISFDDTRRILEMTVVTPPYVLDFAGAYLDQ